MGNEFLKRYCDAVLSEKIHAGKKLKRQLEILWKALHEPQSIMGRNEYGDLIERGIVFDPEKANRPIEFVERFCKVNVAGKFTTIPLTLSQKARDQAAFGFVYEDTGFRVCRERFEVEARKNGKSTRKAATGIYMLAADHEYQAQIACIATAREQARHVFDPAVAMVSKPNALSAILTKRKTDIYSKETAGFFKPLATRVQSLDGLNLHYGILDEMHAMKGRAVYDDLAQSVSTRRQPLIDIITTFGWVREDLFDELYAAAEKELFNDDFADPTKLKFIYEMDERDEIQDPKLWIKANPGIGVIKSYDYIEKALAQAKTDTAFQPTVLTKDFNLPQTKAGTFLSWDEIVNETVAPMDLLRNSYAIGGCDLSATGDLTCSTLMIRKPSDPNFYFLQHYFIPESKLKRVEESKAQEAPYRKWAEQGWLTICPGEQVEYTHVTKWFVDRAKEDNIRPLDIGYDRALSGYWVPEMKMYGFALTKIAQGAYTWTQPMNELKALFGEKRVIYQNNPVTRWCLSNVGAQVTRQEQAITTIQPVKLGTGRRIDGFVSMLNAYACYLKKYEEFMPYVR